MTQAYSGHMAATHSRLRGIRIQLKGLHSTSEMRAMLHEAIDQIEALDVTHVSGTIP